MEKKALGRGLSSLIPTSTRATDATASSLFECELTDIITNPNQPRKLFSKEALDELAASIEEKGILQPLIVRPIGGGKYELIAGERRYRAAKQIGLAKVPVISKDATDDETLEMALIENIQRENLNPIEEALAYRDLLSKFQYTQEELAKRVGKDRTTITNSIRLLKLPDKIRNFLINNQISMGHARALLAIEDKDIQLVVVQDILDKNISVRETEALIKKMKDDATSQINDDAHAVVTIQKPKLEAVHDETTSNPAWVLLADQLKNQLKLSVKIIGDGRAGKLLVSFSSPEDLNRLADLLLTKNKS